MKKLFLILSLITTVALSANAQEFGIKSSATQWATLTTNVEVNFPLSKRVTMHLPVSYNPWKLKQNSRMQQLTFMPGIRLWRQQNHVHYFYSAFAIASRYHIGGWLNHKYRYDGTGYGAGIGFGYSHVINKHWNIEGELGVGVIYADYDKCDWREDSRFYGNKTGVRVIPAKVDISFVYFY